MQWLSLLHNFIQLSLNSGSNRACGVSEIRDGEDLWQWSWLEIRLNAFRRSTIPQKQFINSIQFKYQAIVLCTVKSTRSYVQHILLNNKNYNILFFISMMYFLLSLSMLWKKPFSTSKYAKDMLACRKGTLLLHAANRRSLMSSLAKNIWRGLKHVVYFHKNIFASWILFILFSFSLSFA